MVSNNQTNTYYSDVINSVTFLRILTSHYFGKKQAISELVQSWQLKKGRLWEKIS